MSEACILQLGKSATHKVLIVTSAVIALLYADVIATAAMAQHPPSVDGLPLPEPELTDKEKLEAVMLAAPELSHIAMRFLGAPATPELAAERFARASADDPQKTVVADVQLLYQGEAPDPRRRLALVTLYRYADDLTIRKTVDLTNGVLLDTRSTPHLTPPLTRLEHDAARALALQHPEIRAALGPKIGDVTVEALLVRMPDPLDPLFGHRVVSLLFRTPGGYLSIGREVIVDLTDNAVLLE
jgi:hypothetical protein